MRNRVACLGLALISLACAADDLGSDLHPDAAPGDLHSTTRIPGTWETIPGVTFQMGAPTSDACKASDEMAHSVTLTRTFWMQSTEVTQEQFKEVMGYSPSYFSSCGSSCPVESVSWSEAAAYCNALSTRASQTPCYACMGSGKEITCDETAVVQASGIHACPGYRLPTEAEWEAACRAGGNSSLYSGVVEAKHCGACWIRAASADQVAWYCYNSGGRPHTVGGKEANGKGLYDMHGNVMEWCHDGYHAFLGTKPVKDPVGLGINKVVRGGSWISKPVALRSAARANFAPTFRQNKIGFRCVATGR